MLSANNDVGSSQFPLIQKPSTENNVIELSFIEAMKSVSLFAIPFTLSRVAMAVSVIGNGVVFASLGETVAASGSLSTTILYAVAGPARSALLSTGVMVAKHYGQAKEFEKLDNMEAVEKEYQRIGDIARQGLIFGTLLALPSAGIMYGIGPLLRLIGMSADVLQHTEDFLNATIIGLLPIYWSTTDQQIALGIKYTNIPLVVGGAYAGLSMLFGYPLALGIWGLPKLGALGLGYGISAAAWVSFLSLRLYFLRQEFNPYHLFALKCQGLMTDFSHMLTFGLSMAFQALTEWGNLALLSMLLGLANSNASVAALASIQCITAFTLATGGLGQTVSVQISNLLGQMNAVTSINTDDTIAIINKNIKKIGNAGMLIGILASFIACGLLAGMPNQIEDAFMNHTAASNTTRALAQTMLLVNGIGMIIDTTRNIGTNALGGSKDVLFAPIISLLTMSLLGLSAGACMTILFKCNASWLFITREMGSLSATTGVLYRWLNKEYKPDAILNNIDDNATQKRICCYSFFKQSTLPESSSTSVKQNYATFKS